jgi:hypothetical protein
MSDHNSDDGESSGSGGTLTGTAAQDTASPTDHEGARGRLPGLPGTEKDDCKQVYVTHGLSGIGSESSPSCGWRAVYRQMGVSPDGRH